MDQLMKKNPCILIILFALILPLLMAILAPHPAIAADITLDRNSASVGSKVVVTGTDFAGQTATIHFDDKELVSDIPISSTGSFSHTITIPSAANGEHVIKVTDSSNWSGSTGTITINVVPGISIFPIPAGFLLKLISSAPASRSMKPTLK